MFVDIDKAISECRIDNDAILKTWKESVEIESYTYAPESIKTLHDYYKNKLKALGFAVRSHFFDSSGPVLIGEWGEGEIRDGIILSGHMDTVHKLGTLEKQPFKAEGNIIMGPGVLDMKGGLNLIFYIVKVLKKMDYKKRIKVIICGDEEHGHEHSSAAEILVNESKGYKCAFNVETGLLNNGITVARKGRIGYDIKAYGKSAHAGANFHDGISAITELASAILKIDALNRKYENVTFCIGTMTGGKMINAVPDYAEASVDIRYEDKEETDSIIKDIEEICSAPRNSQARVEAELNGIFQPFSDKDNKKFYELINETSIELGLGEAPAVKQGGSSDAAYLSDSGLPVVCSIGVKGKWHHTEREYALLDSAMERIKLITATILKLETVSLSPQEAS